MAFGSIGSSSPHFHGDDYRAGAIPLIGTGNKGQQAVVLAGGWFAGSYNDCARALSEKTENPHDPQIRCG